jgi:hypothetical protein
VSYQSSEPGISDHSDDENSDVWCKTDKNQNHKHFLGIVRLNIRIDNHESVEVVSAIIGDLFQLFTEQSNISHSQHAQQWKVSPKALKWSKIIPEEIKNFLRLIILMGQARKDNTREYWSNNPIIFYTHFPPQ